MTGKPKWYHLGHVDGFVKGVREMQKKSAVFMCGYDKLDKKGRAEVLKLMAWLHEKSEIEKRFKDKHTSLLCRKCSRKTGYTIRNFGVTHSTSTCELCGDGESAIAVCGSWESKEHWEGEARSLPAAPVEKPKEAM